MARVNIEDSIYRDERFIRFCASLNFNKAAAIGYCVLAWDLAHKWYLKSPTKLIPIKEWEKENIPKEFILCGLAEIRDGGIYIKGSDEHCGYLLICQESGRRGGLKRELNRSNNYHNIIDESSKGSLGFVPSSSSSSSSSLSSSKKEEYMSSDKQMTHPLHELIEIWNENCGSLPKVKASNPMRQRMTLARWKENPDPEYWKQVVIKITKSKFCSGTNKNGWRANYNFFIRPETHLKVSEGNYDSVDYTDSLDWDYITSEDKK